MSFKNIFKGYSVVFKNSARKELRKIPKHFAENIDKYMVGKLSASDRRVLMTKWIGGAWDYAQQIVPVPFVHSKSVEFPCP